MTGFRVYDIQWETDGEVVEGLPRELLVEADDEEDAVNVAGDSEGWLIADCKVEVV